MPIPSHSNEYREYRYGISWTRENDPFLAQPRDIDALRLITSLDGKATATPRSDSVFADVTGKHQARIAHGCDSAARNCRGPADRSHPSRASANVLLIPISDSAEWTAVSVRYQLPAITDRFFSRLASSLPTGPFDPALVRQVWHLSPVANATNRRAHAWPGFPSSPNDLPLPTGDRLSRKTRSLIKASQHSSSLAATK